MMVMLHFVMHLWTVEIEVSICDVVGILRTYKVVHAWDFLVAQMRFYLLVVTGPSFDSAIRAFSAWFVGM